MSWLIVARLHDLAGSPLQIWRFAEPHPDGLNPQKSERLVAVIEQVLAGFKE